MVRAAAFLRNALSLEKAFSEIAPISWTVYGLGSYVSASAVCMLASQAMGERYPRAECSLTGLYQPSM